MDGRALGCWVLGIGLVGFGGVVACGEDEAATGTGGSGGSGGAAPAKCGNGAVEGAEACDDGSQSATCNHDCTVSACGDGIPNALAGEQCDDGGTAAGDGCDATCAIEIPVGCGNSYVSAPEQCDDGGESAGCNIDCTTSACGDGKLNLGAGEECDDGNSVLGDACSSSCQLAPSGLCGNGVCDSGETCALGSCQADCGACAVGASCTAPGDCAPGLACVPGGQGFVCGPPITDPTKSSFIPVDGFACATFIGPANGKDKWVDEGNGSYSLSGPSVIHTPLGDIPITPYKLILTKQGSGVSASFQSTKLPTPTFGMNLDLDVAVKAKLEIITGTEAIAALGGLTLVPKDSKYFQFSFGDPLNNITFRGPWTSQPPPPEFKSGPIANATLIRYLQDPCDPLWLFQVPKPMQNDAAKSMGSIGGSDHGALKLQSALPLWDGTTSKIRPVSGHSYIQGTAAVPSVKLLAASVARIVDFDPKGDGLAHPLVLNTAIGGLAASLAGIPAKQLDIAEMIVGELNLKLPAKAKVAALIGSEVGIDLTPTPLAAASMYTYSDSDGVEVLFRGRTASSLLPGTDLEKWKQIKSHDVQGYFRTATDWAYRYTTELKYFGTGGKQTTDILMRVAGDEVTLVAKGDVDFGSIPIDGVQVNLGKVGMMLYFDWTKKQLCGETAAAIQGAPCVVRLCAGVTAWEASATCESVCGDGKCNGVESCHWDEPACQKDCGACPGGSPCTLGQDCASGHCPTGLCVQCVTNAHCQGKNWCSGLGTCEAPKVNGAACLNAFECASGNCPAGLCVACANQSDCGSPKWCSGLGTCEAPKPSGAVCVNGFECASGKCPLLSCVGCVVHADCSGSEWCGLLDGMCHAKADNGKYCGANAECSSGNCLVGVCVECAQQSHCSGGSWCSGTGSCQPKQSNGTACFAGFECASGNCPAKVCVECAQQSQCTGGDWCAVDGKCYAKKAYGAACAAGFECTSGKCPAGLCVNCVTQGDCSSSAWCAVDGKCYAEKAYGAACAAGFECTSGKCPAGLCVNCAKHSDCSSSKWCAVDGKCYSQKANGGTCTSSAQCVNKCCVGFCGSWC